MDESSREKIFRMSADLVAETSMAFKRYLYSEIDWDTRLLCIKGARGVGKTTMMLQHISEFDDSGKALYVSLDNVWLDAKETYTLAEYHLSHGGTHIFLDEVHKLANWQDLVKSLNDNLKRLKVVYSGSSLLKLEKRGGDLSRRQTPYALDGLSFREYLKFEGVADMPAISLEEILSKHVQLARSVSRKFPVLAYFDAYLEKGYYPFYKEEPRHYLNRIVATVNQVLEVDYPDGVKPNERGYESIMAINHDKTINFVGTNGRIAFQSGAKTVGSEQLLRIEYEKYLSGADDYSYS